MEVKNKRNILNKNYLYIHQLNYKLFQNKLDLNYKLIIQIKLVFKLLKNLLKFLNKLYLWLLKLI